MSQEAEDRTIACLLTPPGEGGISVIEVRGPRAAKAIDRLFTSPRGVSISSAETGQLLYGTLAREGEALDEALVACVESGGEAVFEVNCHGGAIASERVLAALEAEGVERVGAGERLSHLRGGGAVDCIAAEAAERIPKAPTMLAVGHLVDQYRGALASEAKRLAVMAGESAGREAVGDRLNRLLATERFGRGLTEHPRVVLAGRPNVGKSTLANALLRFDRMIVHHVPGTTRDAVDEVFSIGGVPFLLVDIAGIRETDHEIEREGVMRGREEIGRADIVLVVFDGSAPLQPEDTEFLKDQSERTHIAVVNKCDLPPVIDVSEIERAFGRTLVSVSGVTDEGITELEERILGAACPVLPARGEPVVFTERQGTCLREGLQAAEAGDWGGVAAQFTRLVEG